MEEINLVPIVAAVAILAVITVISLAFAWRVVVPTNVVHIVQSARKTISYGGGQEHNAYYSVPSFVPYFGVTRVDLPVNNFSIFLDSYDAYDKDRLPFELDLMGFFVINDTNKAAARVASFGELEGQLRAIMQGAARTVLAQHDIHEIMGDRAKFGEAFTKEVDEGLSAWGVKAVKSLELMDIRDVDGSKVIANIMAKKSSEIDMESRRVVAENKRVAEIAEVEAAQAIELRKAEQAQAVGERKAQQAREVGIANEKADQEIQSQAKVTMERTMDVQQVQTVRQAEIAARAAIVKAEQEQKTQVIAAEAERQVRITEAEGEKQQTALVAEGKRDAAMLNAQGLRAEGEARGDAEKAMQMAPVAAQLALADKIATEQNYQTYLVSIRQVEASEKIGIANASALAAAQIKVIATSGDAQSGIASVSEVLGARGGTKIGAMLEGLANSEVGAQLLSKIGLADAKPVGKANGAAR